MFLVAAYGAICSFALSRPERAVVAAVAPFATLGLYFLWVHQGIVISSIAQYINRNLSDPCCKWLGADVLMWDKLDKSQFLNPGEHAVRRRVFLVAHMVFSVVMPLGACIIAFRGLAAELGFWRYLLIAAGAIAAFVSFAFFGYWYRFFYGKSSTRERNTGRSAK